MISKTVRHIRVIFFVCISLILLCGCGGSETTDTTPVIDTTPVTIDTTPVTIDATPVTIDADAAAAAAADAADAAAADAAIPNVMANDAVSPQQVDVSSSGYGGGDAPAPSE